MIHNQKEKDFMKGVLEILKQKGVLLPKMKLTSLVSEYAPNTSEPPEEWQGRVLGSVNADMRLLWALGQRFAEESGMYSESEDEEIWHKAWETDSSFDKMRRISLCELSELCCDAFWMLTKERFAEKIDLEIHSFVLKSNWSICAVASANMPPLPGRLEQVLRRIEGQFIAFNLSTI